MDYEAKQHVSSTRAAVLLWLFTVVIIDAGILVGMAAFSMTDILIAIPFAVVSLVCGLPALLVLLFVMALLQKSNRPFKTKLLGLHISIAVLALCYGSIAFLDFWRWQPTLPYLAGITGVVYAAGALSIFINRQLLKQLFNTHYDQYYYHPSSSKNNVTMEESTYYGNNSQNTYATTGTNKILIKGIITAMLILVMLIPTAFVQSLITERQERQKEVVEEVSSKWAKPQTVSAPYLVIPYTEGKVDPEKKQLVILPDQLDVKGTVSAENRPRSIYKVLLYKSKLSFTGSFHAPITLPDSATLQPAGARLCFGLSDFRGIEEKIGVTFNNSPYALQPGLPTDVIDRTGLSVPVTITQADIEKGIPFSLGLALRGSGSLHFLPIGANSHFNIQSAWPDPSFDGKTLPAERSISGKGFDASWQFNAANLPFTNVLQASKNLNTNDIEFGVSLVQPADQYVQSMRSAKYAILIIGLTFVVFFIFELMQKKPVHPVQYGLVGMALVIFYTLLVSISEIILFGYAYTIAAVATIVLISMYAKSHFKTLRSSFIFGALLSGLYGFIYVLISLEDTALLVGSIALFIVLAIIMYVTRKVNWYQPELPQPVTDVQP